MRSYRAFSVRASGAWRAVSEPHVVCEWWYRFVVYCCSPFLVFWFVELFDPTHNWYLHMPLSHAGDALCVIFESDRDRGRHT